MRSVNIKKINVKKNNKKIGREKKHLKLERLWAGLDSGIK